MLREQYPIVKGGTVDALIQKLLDKFYNGNFQKIFKLLIF